MHRTETPRRSEDCRGPTSAGFFRAILLVTTFALLSAGPTVFAVDFIRSDANGDGAMSLADAHGVFMETFVGPRLQDCPAAKDANSDGRTDIADGVWILNTLYRGGPEPAAPYPEPGPAGPDELLPCNDFGGVPPLVDEAATVAISSALAAGGDDRLAVLTISVTNSRPIAALSLLIEFPEGTLDDAKWVTDLTGNTDVDAVGNINRASLDEDGLRVLLIPSLTKVVEIPASSDLMEVASLEVCLAPEIPAGDLPLTLVEAEFVDSRSSRAIYPNRVDGTLTVTEAIAESADCELTDPEDGGSNGGDTPPSPIGPQTVASNVTFRIPDATALPGAPVTLPFIIHADGGVQGFAMSVDFDEEILTATAIEPLWEIPGGFTYDFAIYEFNNDNNTPGNGGVDEGFAVAAVVFELTEHVAIPADEDVEVVSLRFDVAESAKDEVTFIRFVDGAQGSGEPVTNLVTSGGETIDPELLESFTRVDCTLAIGVDVDITTFRRGDSNGDEAFDLSDPQWTLNYLFLSGGRPPCFDAADTNDDGDLDISDAVAALSYLFLGGAPPPPPFPEEGRDPTDDPMSCAFRLSQ